jgi:hypothetical protein
MEVGILKSDGGSHTPDMWAQITASQIINIASSAPEILLSEARSFEQKLITLLTDYHDQVQKDEQAVLAKEGCEHLNEHIDTSKHLHDCLDEVIKLAKGTSFANHFDKPETKAYIERVIHEHFHHSMHIERSWHADKHPDHEHSKIFKDNTTNGRVGAWAGNPPPRKVSVGG